MTVLEEKCKKECRRVVIEQAGGVCEMCDKAIGEQHHGVFRSSQRYKLNAEIRYDPDLQFCLCADDHKYAKKAPHVDNEAFLRAMREKGGTRAYKAYKVEAVCIGPLKIKDNREIDFEAMLAELKAR